MQQAALDALGIPATYERWHTTSAELPARTASLRETDALGANVTVPHKLAVIDLVDDVSTLAVRAGAVNTILNREGRLFGDNTDVYGFVAMLLSVCPDVGNRSAVILGAGGAARAVVLGLEQVGVTSITIANRDPLRAQQLARSLEPIGVETIALCRGGLADSLNTAGVMINATSLGWHPGEMPIEPALLRNLPTGAIILDLTYRDTDLLIAARMRGLATSDGLPMLVHQGAKAFELFTGQAAPVEIMMAAALQAREARA